jgi:hypothetical protein
MQLQRGCRRTLRWLISFSLDPRDSSLLVRSRISGASSHVRLVPSDRGVHTRRFPRRQVLPDTWLADPERVLDFGFHNTYRIEESCSASRAPRCRYRRDRSVAPRAHVFVHSHATLASNSLRSWRRVVYFGRMERPIGSNKALERTIARNMFMFEMIETVSVRATLALGGGRSAYSR